MECSVVDLEKRWRPASPANLQGLRTGRCAPGSSGRPGRPPIGESMSVPPLLNAAGRRRSPVTLPGYLAGRPPRNKGLRYPPDPPTVEEIVAVMRQAGASVHGARLRALIVLLLARGSADQRGAHRDRARPGARRRVGARPTRQGRPPPPGRHGPVGLGPPPALARTAHRDAGRPAAVRDRGYDSWAALGERRRPRPAAARRLQGQCAQAVRAPPANVTPTPSS
jgi:hypothetical protein